MFLKPQHQTVLSIIMQASPLSFKRQAENKLGSIRKKLRFVQQNRRKLKIKVSCLTQVITSVKEKLLISSSCAEMLDNSFSGVHKTLLSRKVQGKRSKVSEELRSFAIDSALLFRQSL